MDFTWDEASGLIRHALTAGAGVLVADGYINASDSSALVGAAMLIIGVAWSIASKKLAKARLQALAPAPVAPQAPMTAGSGTMEPPKVAS